MASMPRSASRSWKIHHLSRDSSAGLADFSWRSPAYIARHGRPRHPRDLGAHQCLSYAIRAKRDVWRFTHGKQARNTSSRRPARYGERASRHCCRLYLKGWRSPSSPNSSRHNIFARKSLSRSFTDWRLPEGGLYFVTPTARARPAKVSALADFLIAKLTNAPWSAEAVMGWKLQRGKRPKISRSRGHSRIAPAR